MANAVEKEEFADDECLDQHDEGCCNYREQANNIADSDCIEDCIARTGHGFLEQRHCSGVGGDMR